MITVQGTGSNKASNTEALQYLVDNTKGNLYKFTDHSGTVYWFTSTNAVTMTGDTVTVAGCDYVVGNGTMVYSGGTLVFTKRNPDPFDGFPPAGYTEYAGTGIDGVYNVISSSGERSFNTIQEAISDAQSNIAEFATKYPHGFYQINATHDFELIYGIEVEIDTYGTAFNAKENNNDGSDYDYHGVYFYCKWGNKKWYWAEGRLSEYI